MKNYIALIELDGKSNGVVFPDFPGCVSVGDNYADAIRMAHEALSIHVEGMKDAGEQIPEPRTLEEIKANWEDWSDWKDTDYATTLISLLPNHATKKYTISMDAELMARIDMITKNRSAFLADAARKILEIGC